MKSRLIDVREYPEFAEGHIEGAELVPLGTLDRASEGWDRAESLTLVCRTGRRAEQARQTLAAKGFQGLSVHEGGIEAWSRDGKPLLVAAHRPWSMERQVRVGAGSLVLTFFGLGLLTSKKFFLGAALVGAGLIYAGVTDNCMMASVLGRMPWNDPGKANT
ncbi:MAG: rhodanese-like domain-containing protein [Granulicella sp.]